jgi:hypothetical protein
VSNSVAAGWHGHDYQARFFWLHASALRDPDQAHVVEVSYEADGPKAFDDVVVKYSPPRAGTGPLRIAVDYHQVKFHVTIGGRFGFEDLIDPAFINATSFSVLERLLQAKLTAPANSAFTLVTTDSIKDGDPLNDIISTVDHSLRLDKLFDGTGKRARMGKVRELWRTHLKLPGDAELREVLEGLHITSGHRSLVQMRDDVNARFKSVGLITCHDTSEFRFDGTARALKAAGRYVFTRADFDQLCQEEGWIRADEPEGFLNVSLRSFADGPTTRYDAAPENSLSLLPMFDDRQLRPGGDWTSGVQPTVVGFLQRIKATGKPVRLYLDAHASIAFLAGTVFGLKSGMAVELVQKGRAPTTVWRADDGEDGPSPVVSTEAIGAGGDAALVVSLSHDAIDDVRDYVTRALPEVGRIIHVLPEQGPGQGSVAGGAHAARIADTAAAAVKKARLPFGATVHLFITGPNGFTFFLGQHREAMGQCVMYEFDFKRSVDGSYHPTFKMD